MYLGLFAFTAAGWNYICPYPVRVQGNRASGKKTYKEAFRSQSFFFFLLSVLNVIVCYQTLSLRTQCTEIFERWHSLENI